MPPLSHRCRRLSATWLYWLYHWLPLRHWCHAITDDTTQLLIFSPLPILIGHYWADYYISWLLITILLPLDNCITHASCWSLRLLIRLAVTDIDTLLILRLPLSLAVSHWYWPVITDIDAAIDYASCFSLFRCWWPLRHTMPARLAESLLTPLWLMASHTIITPAITLCCWPPASWYWY